MAEHVENKENRQSQRKGKGRGFASMDAARQREIASKGGKASALGNTSNRGFASMDVEKQREISRKGGLASHQKRDRQSEKQRPISTSNDSIAESDKKKEEET
jgi:general stress protein YciG